MSTYFSYTVPDPFVTTTDVINPLQITGNSNEYSVKLTVYNTSTKQNQVFVYSGTFDGTQDENSVGLQAIIMDSLQTIIRLTFDPSYLVGRLPHLGRPGGYIFSADDIVVSFTDNDDYFVFAGTGTGKSITFLSTGQTPVVYSPGSAGTIMNTFASSGSPGPVDIYDVTYEQYGVFDIIVNSVDTLVLDTVTTAPTTIATYNATNLTENTEVNGEITYSGDYYTRTGITILPASLPVDQSDLVFAETVDGLFYTEGAVATVQPLIDYLEAQASPAFTSSQLKFVTCVCNTIFSSVNRCVKRLLGIDNRDSYTTNSGLACAVSMQRVAFEIRLS